MISRRLVSGIPATLLGAAGLATAASAMNSDPKPAVPQDATAPDTATTDSAISAPDGLWILSRGITLTTAKSTTAHPTPSTKASAEIATSPIPVAEPSSCLADGAVPRPGRLHQRVYVAVINPVAALHTRVCCLGLV